MVGTWLAAISLSFIRFILTAFGPYNRRLLLARVTEECGRWPPQEQMRAVELSGPKGRFSTVLKRIRVKFAWQFRWIRIALEYLRGAVAGR
ncbi:hypothetical protein GCM10017056_52630 [Seohaeicola zhoushanensis]|uniref:Uncharacterized protein n=1 Tax=Seohaeicola zhoushanensis TaxID=1569283 RepID=A0A8J3H3X1_9RHOB|nr:hypothetical protein GCM10017056_52630 [Seohaeicola zhoushanensis]